MGGPPVAMGSLERIADAPSGRRVYRFIFTMM